MALRNILRLAATEKASGLKKSAIYDGVAKGTFPRPVKITDHAVGWYEDEIRAWQESRQRAEGGWSPRERKRRQSREAPRP